MKKLFFITFFLFNLNILANPEAIVKTNQGSFKIRLYADKAPVTVRNFITLSNKKFYDNINFHRVIKDFMIQTGDPTGTGAGGPGYTFNDEIHPSLSHDKAGILSMANRGPNTNGSQFFITVSPAPHLDGKHSIFGKVIDGMDVINKINSLKTDFSDRPLQPVNILSITLTGSNKYLLPQHLIEETEKKILPLVEMSLKVSSNHKLANISIKDIKKRGKVIVIIWTVKTLNKKLATFWLKGIENEYGINIIETHFNFN